MTCRIIILAAGQGKRMGLPIPKVLAPLHGKPLIKHLLDAVYASGLDPRPIIVIAPDTEGMFKKEIGANCEFVVQSQRLGTGHAVSCARGAAQGTSDAIIVLYGDMPFIKPETIRTLAKEHAARRPAITMLTNTVPNFVGAYAPFADFGRVIRSAEGAIQNIIEKKDATPEQLAITEVNPSYFCFDSAWLWSTVDTLTNNNSQGEYYLVDLVRIAIESGKTVRTLDTNPLESIGINTPEHLEHAHRVSMH